jgi:isoleucyl-tRNA synthetase
VLDLVFERLTAWLNPIAPFTMHEAWASRFPDDRPNAFRVIPDTPADWQSVADAERWSKIEQVTSAVTAALEVERREKRIGSSLEAAPVVTAGADLLAAFEGLDAAEIFRTSSARFKEGGEGVSVDPALAEGEKCARCWRILTEVKPATQLCLRCEDAVAAWDKAHSA